MIRPLLLFAATALLPLLFVHCDKEPKVITEIVTKTDTLVVTIQDTVVQHVTDTLILSELVPDTATTFILLRHAETSGAGSDPALSAAGQQRAAELVRVLKNVPVQAVYATSYLRTTQTAQPTATDKSLNVQTYDPFAPGPLTDAVLNAYQGQAVLIVGHSNTIPALLNVLTGTNDFAQIPDTQYDNLFIVSVFEKGRAKVTHLKYGNP